MSIATLIQGASPFGPIFAKELRVTARRRRTYWLRVVYLGLLLLVLLWAWAIASEMGRGGGMGVATANQQRSMLGQTFFAIFGIFSVYTMGLIGPILTSTAVGSERLQKTLPVLLMTPISAWQIVAGKLFSRLLVALTLIALGLPVLALVRLLGGVELGQMLSIVGLAAVAAISSAAIGLFYSTLLNRSYVVILLSYGTMLFGYAFVPTVILMIAGLARVANPFAWMELIFAFNPYWMAWPAAMPSMMGGAGMMGELPWGWCVGTHLSLTALLLMFSALLLRRQARGAGERTTTTAVAMAGSAPPMTAPPPPPPLPEPPTQTGVLNGPDEARPAVIGYRPAIVKRAAREVADNPVLWRELRRPLMGRGWQRVVAVLLLGGVLLTFYGIQGYAKELGDADVQIAYAFVFNFLFCVLALVISSTTVAQEKESDTWTLLLATPISGSTIVWGKALGVYRRLAWPFALVIGHFLLFTVTGVISVPTFLVTMWVIFSFNTVWVATGVYLSLRLSRTTVAVILNLLLGIAVYAVVPAILGFVSVWTDSNKVVRQVWWYMPYYYLAKSIEGMQLSHGSWVESTMQFEPLRTSIPTSRFILIAFVIGGTHVLIAGGVLAHTSHHFNRIVGRAPQRLRLSTPDRVAAAGLR